LLVALALGLLGDGLLRTTPWGINVGLWIVLLLLSLFAGITADRSRSRPASPVTLAAALLFAAGFAWRDSPALRGLDLLGLGVSAGLLLWQRWGGHLGRAGFLDCTEGLAQAGAHTVVGLPILLARDIDWSEVKPTGALRQTPAVLAGLALSLPLLLIFGGLFVAADAAYRRLVHDILQFDFVTWMSHGALFGAITWGTAGFLRGATLMHDSPPRLPRPRRFGGLGPIEAGTVLATLNLLFLTFVMVQFRYLFGGAQLVEQTLGVTYAEYAREGFFQLVTVAGLVLPLLWFLDWLHNPAKPRTTFRWLARMMIALLAVIMASALFRMRLYQREFGLTELRLYASAFMLALVVVLVWFCFTVLLGKRERFLGGALLTALVAVGLLHWLNPDAWIVRANARHAIHSGRPFDVPYAVRLSADALPALCAVLPELPPDAQADLRDRLKRRLSPGPSTDWRTWNWSRARAATALARGRATDFASPGREAGVKPVRHGGESPHQRYGGTGASARTFAGPGG
jgi:hypothetical protein